MLRGTWPTWPVSPRPAGAARRGGGTADPLSVLGAGAEVDYLEQFGASSVSTQRRAAPLTRGRLGVPGGSHPRPTWLRPQRHLLCAGLPRGTGQAGTLGTLLTLLPPSQFKESALRKQSLYLNFDPLLQDSPWALAPSGYAQPAARTGGGGAGLPGA